MMHGRGGQSLGRDGTVHSDHGMRGQSPLPPPPHMHSLGAAQLVVPRVMTVAAFEPARAWHGRFAERRVWFRTRRG